jgi:hypothetical protein
MKSPSKNITGSLKGQKPGGRGAEPVEVSRLKSGVSMTVPGTGDVETAPGMLRDQDRSAVNFADKMPPVK